MSVVFDFNDSLNDVAPVSPVLLSVDGKIKEKNELLMEYYVCLLSFVFTTQIKFGECCDHYQYFTQRFTFCEINKADCLNEEK